MAVWQQNFKLFFVVIGLLWPVTALAQERAVSTSLCGDAYLLELLSAGQIKSLSWQANSSLSYAATEQKHPIGAWADKETLLFLSPAKIVLGPDDQATVTNLAVRKGSKVLQLNWANDFSDVENNLTQLGTFLDKQPQAKLVVSKLKTKLQHLKTRHNTRSRPKILYLTPTLGSAGSGTFIDAAIKAAGGTNLATDLEIIGWGQIPLETLAIQKPDLIISSFFQEGPPSFLQFRANHSIIKQMQNQVPQVHISGGLWVCAGPLLIQAAEQIANAIDQLPLEEIP